ncbi:MAG: site-specific DNA-methyltransferase [Bacteroidales bacterium]|nr:site-specific DNA-methyltransferase [Bacteroidales bacterium]
MAAINDLIEQIENPELRLRLQQEVNKLNKQRKFGLVFEDHVPENTFLYDVPVKRGSLVAKRDNGSKDTYRVVKIEDGNALCEQTVSHEQETNSVDSLVSVAQLGEPIYPYLKPMGEVMNAPDNELWHTLIEADNYHALQLLVYLYGGKVDCIYIDPPYNSGAKDWKYNNDYVDENDNYRHSKWLSMMEKRLLLAKKLLNPKDSVLMVTIDDKEYYRLGCLLEQVFPEAKITMISSVINPAGKAKKGGVDFSRTDEYVYFLQLGESVVLPETREVKKSPIAWEALRRHSIANGRGKHGVGACGPNQFYPFYIDKVTKKIIEIGEPIPETMNRFDVKNIEGCETVFPVRDDGREMNWGCVRETALDMYKKGYLRVGQYYPNKPQQFNIVYITKGNIKAIENGEVIVTKSDEFGFVEGYYPVGKPKVPTTSWNKPTHNATSYGTDLINSFFKDGRFDYPKSIYAVYDCLRFFVANKLNALILDFFAGSGTTLNAVNLLNSEDGGFRRCIMVTNNEIGEEKERELKPQGIRPGDEEWEKWGIARYVNWPRTECSIKGIDVNGNEIDGEYITSSMQTKRSERRYNQINFLTDAPTLKQKKAVVALINKQKTVKLPTISEDVDFLLAEEENTCNASILFNVSAIDDWKDALEGHDEITDFYIVTQKDALFKRIKDEVSDMMGQIEESVPVTIPMKDGFKTNAAYFKLGFLDKTSVALGRQFKELLPILWMKAGARGECPIIEKEELPKMLVCEKNHFAVLIDENAYPLFEAKMNQATGIDTVYIVTDSDSGYKEMAQQLHVETTYQLYRDYLDNFRINNVR